MMSITLTDLAYLGHRSLVNTFMFDSRSYGYRTFQTTIDRLEQTRSFLYYMRRMTLRFRSLRGEPKDSQARVRG
jgi:hypothetical protein